MTKWEAIAQVLMSGNGLTTLLFVILIILLAGAALRLGLVHVHTSAVTIGNSASEQERTVMRHQVEYIRQSCNAFEVKIPKDETYDKYRGRFVIERVFDEMLNWIIFNHIEDNRVYISTKQKIIWNIVVTHTVKEMHHSEEFKDAVFKSVEGDIQELAAIRRYYQKSL